MRYGRVIFILWLLMQTAQAADGGWVLALSWHPGFCASHGDLTECAKPLGLVLHGLWPEAARGPDPGYCGVSPELRASDRDEWCKLPPLALSAATRSAVVAIMPGSAVCLDRHEWFRHGTCTGWSPEQYLKTGAILTDAVQRLTLARWLGQHGGTHVRASDLGRAAAVDFGERAAAVEFVCAERHDAWHLAEVRISLVPGGPKQFPDASALRVPAYPVEHACPADRPIAIDAP